MEENREILVSIIIPVYQVKDTLRRCVLSCLNQKFVAPSEMEVILVDDGSTDGSAKICDALKEEDEHGRIIVIHGKNFGVSHARNLGIERACGRFLVFVDSDDEVKDEYLETLMKYADESTALVDETNINVQSGKISGFQYIENQIPSGKTHVWGKLFDRKAVLDAGCRFQEGLSIGEDLLFLIDFSIAQEKRHTIRCIKDGDYIYTDNVQGAMKQEFKESYLGEIVSWRKAEEKLNPYRQELSNYAFVSLSVSQIMTALLVVGKIAVMDEDKRDKDLTALALSEASQQIEHALKTPGAFAGLSFGYKLKVMLFRFNQNLYLKMYHNHKA